MFEYPKMGNLDRVRASDSLRKSNADEAVRFERLAHRLSVPEVLLSQNRFILPDGLTIYSARVRWCVLIKAIIEDFAGALDLCIDGLNQVPPNTRAKIADFMTQFVRGNIFITTQPMSWRAPKMARCLRLQPLTQDKILAFLQSREPMLPSGAKIRGAPFKTRCQEWLPKVLCGTEGDAAAMVLSNPMDATVAAECLSSGKEPDVLDLREQQHQSMAAEYQDETGKVFPLEKVAETAYQMRVSGKEEFVADDELKAARDMMAEHRLLIHRTRRQDGLKGEDEQWWAFRHDKFLEFFVVHAFRGANRERRVKHLGDPPFRGVYLRLALVLPMKDAEDLREMLIEHAAATGDHTTSDDYIRIFKQRKKQKND
jgi:hypothetical protein